MKFKCLVAFFIAASGVFFFSSSGYSMEEEGIDPEYSTATFRVQIFSYRATQGIEDGHREFERLAEFAPTMKASLGHLVKEERSIWIRGQFGCRDESTAQTLAKTFEEAFELAGEPKGTHVVAPGTVSKNQDLRLQFAIRHAWKTTREAASEN